MDHGTNIPDQIVLERQGEDRASVSSFNRQNQETIELHVDCRVVAKRVDEIKGRSVKFKFVVGETV